MGSPILNSPYKEPEKHYYTNPDGTLNYEKIENGRRLFSPDIQSIPVRSTGQDNISEVNEPLSDYASHLINTIRREVKSWREEGYPHTTGVTRKLLNFWFNNPERIASFKLFFAQQEAVETAIYLNEAAEKTNQGNNILHNLSKGRDEGKDSEGNILPRTAFKMATGTGKTVVMACLILYHYFNRQEYKTDTRFSDYFLIITPGITIKDRLSVLFVDKTNRGMHARDYYRQRDLVPVNYENMLAGLNAKIVITNYHSLEPRTFQGNKKTPFDGKKDINGNPATFENLENYSHVIKRTMSSFRQGSRLLVLNDEAHHCYLPKSKGSTTDNEDKDENQRAAVWFTAIAEIAKKFSIRNVYDLSATPYYLNGSGYPAYSLFGWVVSDFGLIEAIESGLVKIPFLPVSDNSHETESSKFINIYEHVKAELPRKGMRKRKKDASDENEKFTEEPPKLPVLVKQALDSFYSHYKKYSEGVREAGENNLNLFSTPPVFIIVCNNTSVSKEVYKYIAGYQYSDKDGNLFTTTGFIDEFSNFDPQTLKPRRKPPTLLIDSDALDNSEQIDDNFKKIFEAEIEEFRKDIALQSGSGAAERLTDGDILREVVNTVGKANKLGSHIKCVVSVSMLTEGWDANTVTHVMGLRAFGSQLLCEQVAGRALRRTNYFLQGYDKDGEPTDDPKKVVTEKFPAEYAHIIGIPFKMMKGGDTEISYNKKEVKHIRAIPERQKNYELIFPNLQGYRLERPGDTLKYNFDMIENFEIDSTKYPTEAVLATGFSEQEQTLKVSEVFEKREQELIYRITQSVISFHFASEENGANFSFFPELKKAVEYWYRNKIVLLNIKGDHYKKLIYFYDPKSVADHIIRGINPHLNKTEYIKPLFYGYNKFGSTKYVNGNTVKEVFSTKKSHVNYVARDSDWEAVAAKSLEELPQVISYVKNHFLGFTIPYVKDGKDKLYYPDFIIKCKTESGSIYNLILEISGMSNDKDEKKWYVESRWLPAVNSVREKYGYDEWKFIEIANDIRNIKNQLTEVIEGLS